MKDLPYDLLVEIAKHLRPPNKIQNSELSSLSATSTHFHGVFHPILYRHIRVDCYTKVAEYDDLDDPSSHSTRFKQLCYALDNPMNACVVESLELFRLCDDVVDDSISDLQRVQAHLKNVEVLRLDHILCCRRTWSSPSVLIKSFHLPKLSTFIIRAERLESSHINEFVLQHPHLTTIDIWMEEEEIETLSWDHDVPRVSPTEDDDYPLANNTPPPITPLPLTTLKLKKVAAHAQFFERLPATCVIEKASVVLHDTAYHFVSMSGDFPAISSIDRAPQTVRSAIDEVHTHFEPAWMRFIARTLPTISVLDLWSPKYFKDNTPASEAGNVHIKEIISLLSLFTSISHFSWNSCGRVPEETKHEHVLAVRAFGEAAPTLRYITLYETTWTRTNHSAEWQVLDHSDRWLPLPDVFHPPIRYTYSDDYDEYWETGADFDSIGSE